MPLAFNEHDLKMLNTLKGEAYTAKNFPTQMANNSLIKKYWHNVKVLWILCSPPGMELFSHPKAKWCGIQEISSGFKKRRQISIRQVNSTCVDLFITSVPLRAENTRKSIAGRWLAEERGSNAVVPLPPFRCISFGPSGHHRSYPGLSCVAKRLPTGQ